MQLIEKVKSLEDSVLTAASEAELKMDRKQAELNKHLKEISDRNNQVVFVLFLFRAACLNSFFHISLRGLHLLRSQVDLSSSVRYLGTIFPVFRSCLRVLPRLRQPPPQKIPLTSRIEWMRRKWQTFAEPLRKKPKLSRWRRKR
jgi:hypothetical protein